MAPWFTGRRKLVEIPRLKPRGKTRRATQVDLAELAPALTIYLGQAACLQLAFFQWFSQAASLAESLEVKERIGRAASLAISKHESLTIEIDKHGDDLTAAMEPFATTVQNFRRITVGADWQENLLGAYLTSGLLEDFYVRMAAGLPHDIAGRVIDVLAAESGYEPIVLLLQDAIAENPPLGSRLALWGRRLVGDTLLLARDALTGSGDPHSDEEQIEPLFTELIAAHTRRMDALGLTA